MASLSWLGNSITHAARKLQCALQTMDQWSSNSWLSQRPDSTFLTAIRNRVSFRSCVTHLTTRSTFWALNFQICPTLCLIPCVSRCSEQARRAFARFQCQGGSLSNRLAFRARRAFLKVPTASSAWDANRAMRGMTLVPRIRAECTAIAEVVMAQNRVKQRKRLNKNSGNRTSLSLSC